MRLTRPRSAAAISLVPRSWRLRLVLFLVKMWLVKDCLCLKPCAVFLKRLLALLLVFILGIAITPHSVNIKSALDDKTPSESPGVSGQIQALLSLFGTDDHHQLAPFHFRVLLDNAVLFQIFFDPLEYFHAELLMGHFTTTVTNRHLGFVPFGKETYQVA